MVANKQSPRFSATLLHTANLIENASIFDTTVYCVMNNEYCMLELSSFSVVMCGANRRTVTNIKRTFEHLTYIAVCVCIFVYLVSLLYL